MIQAQHNPNQSKSSKPAHCETASSFTIHLWNTKTALPTKSAEQSPYFAVEINFESNKDTTMVESWHSVPNLSDNQVCTSYNNKRLPVAHQWKLLMQAATAGSL